MGFPKRGSKWLVLGLLTLGLLWASVAPVSAAADAGSTARLQSAVARLNAFLGGDLQAEGWRRFLLLNVLDTQAAKGEQADIEMLSLVYERFSSNAPGLGHPAFNDVRNAISDQIRQLSASQFMDIRSALVDARNRFKPATISQLESQRKDVQYDLAVLVAYYRQTLANAEREELLAELQVEELQAALSGIEFKLAPEVSVGKMDSMIKDVEKELEAVVEELDALPLIPRQENQPAADEQEIELIPGVIPPTPDDKKLNRVDLEAKVKLLQTKIAELNEQRAEVLSKDRPRLIERSRTFRELRGYEQRFAEVSKQRGDPYFVAAMMSLRRLVLGYAYGTADNLQEEFLLKLADLENAYVELDATQSRQSAGQVGNLLGWFEQANQLGDLATAIRARYSLPNLYVGVSANLINQVASQSRSENRAIRDMVGGRLLRGQAQTNATVLVDLVEDPNQVHASIHLVGGVTSQTYVEQTGVKVFADADGELEGRRSIFANIGGLFANDPEVAAFIQSSFRGTSSRLRIINRIAQKKFGEAKSAGESYSANKAEGELMQQFGQQTNEPIENGQVAIVDAQKRLMNKSQFVPALYLRSFRDKILVVGKKAASDTLGSPNHPLPTQIASDVNLRLHDSAASNYLAATFAGKTYSEKELAEEIQEILGDSGSKSSTVLAAAPEDAQETFSITFADVRPIQIEFEDNAFAVVVSGTKFEQGGTAIDAGLKITLRFKIKRIAGKLKFVREGKAELDYLEPEDKPARVVAFRSFLDGKLNPQNEAEEISVELPENLLPVDQVEALQKSDVAKGLRLVQCRAEGGWVYLGWAYVGANAHSTASWLATDTPAIWIEPASGGAVPDYSLYQGDQGEGQIEHSVEVGLPGAEAVSSQADLRAGEGTPSILNAPLQVEQP